MMPWACAVRNSRQAEPVRRGVGSVPAVQDPPRPSRLRNLVEGAVVRLCVRSGDAECNYAVIDPVLTFAEAYVS